MTTNNASDIFAAAERSAHLAMTYGVNETSPLWTSEVTHETLQDEVYLDDPRLERIARLRLLGEGGYPFWDISYCYGVLKDGTHVRVHLDEHRISRRNAKGDLIAMARRAGVNAKRLGLLDNWSTLR